MHPYLREDLIEARRHDLPRRPSPGQAPPSPRRTGSDLPLRRNAGWLLVGIGLRLALGRGGNARSAPATSR